MEENIKYQLLPTDNYTIIATMHTCGSITACVPKEIVRKECERIKKIFEKTKDEGTYQRIEVVNNQTGQIREYWNSTDNKIQF